MSKASVEAFTKLQELIESGKIIQIEKFAGSTIEITVFEDHSYLNHYHVQGETLIEVLNKIDS